MKEYALAVVQGEKKVLLKSDTRESLLKAADKLLAIGINCALPKQDIYQMIKVVPQDDCVILEKPDGTTLVVLTELDDFMTKQEKERREQEGTLVSEQDRISLRQKKKVLEFFASS